MWRVCAVLVACGTWAAPMAAADRSWDEEPFRASAAELARAAAALSRDEPAAVRVLLSETELTYDEAGRRTSRERIVYVIETDAGREGWDTLTVTWAPWHQARPELRARVVTRDGREHLLDPATIAESAIGEADDKVFSDRRRLAAPLPAVTVGAIVEHQSVVRDESAWFPAGTVTRLYLGANAPVTRARLAIESPSSMALRFSTELLPGLEPRSSEIAGRTRHVFEADHLDPFLPAEPNLPPDAPRWPNVTVSTAASWSAVARAYADVVERQLQGVNVSAQAREAGGKNRGRREVVQQLLKRLDEIRYTGVQFGQASFVPRRPDEVLARRYGDCKDKATLLVAWLRAAGIPASLALLAAGYDQDVPETLPGMGLFNHAIVYVPGSPALWIDPTVERARAGELPLNDQGRLALVADPDTTGLVRIPESTASENSVVQAREFRLSEMGTASVAESAEYRGVFDRHHRGRWSTEAEADLRKAQESYVREEYLAESVSTLDHGPVEDLDRPFRVTTQAKDAQRGYTDEKGAVVVYFPGRLTADLPAALLPPDAGAAPPEEETREGAFFFPIPHVVEHRYRIVPPPGFRLSELPQPEDVPLGGGRYSSHWTTTPDGVVTGTVRFESGPRTIDATRFEEMRRGVKELRARPGVAVRFLQSGEAHLGDGRIREALTEFEKLAALHPKEALHRTQVALALLSGGLGDEARREARLAVEMEPASLLAQRRLGWVLQHDSLGRRFAKGFDLTGSVAAYRRAVELKPDDVHTRSNLAYLLEFNEQGEHYGPGAPLKEAADQYWRLAREHRTPMTNLVYALLRSGRHDELPQAARLFESQVRDGFEVLAAAVTEGADGAMRRAARISQPDERRRSLQEAADELLRIRRYGDGAVLLEAAAQGATNAAALRARAEIVKRVRAHESTDVVAPGPEGTIRTLMRALLYDWSPERILDLVDEGERQRSRDEENRTALQLLQRQFTRQRRLLNIPPSVFADMTLSALELGVEGDEARGYRVRVRNPTGAAMPPWYIVKRADRYLILGSGFGLQSLGVEALRRADAGDLDGARWLLDWAREEVVTTGDDPFAGPPLLRNWSVGQKDGIDAVRVAAASLLVPDPTVAARGIEILEAARERATDERTRARIDDALVIGYLRVDRPADALAASLRLDGEIERSESVRAGRYLALTAARDDAELRRWATSRLATHADDLWASRALRLSAIDSGDFAGAEQRCARLLESGKGQSSDFNDCAWNGLFLPPPRTSSIERARRAVELSGKPPSRATVHTLASLYAAEGLTTEARNLMLEALEQGTADEPQPEDWFVFGRIAEAYGRTEAAEAAYRKVGRSGDFPQSTWVLAQQRLNVRAEQPRHTAKPRKGR